MLRKAARNMDILNPRNTLTELTRLNPFDRFPDGSRHVPDELLEKYLENQTPVPAETAIAAIDGNDEIDANDMKDMLADVSDEDLQQYIEKYSTVKAIQTN
jgi:hypothetical protein